MGKEVKTNAMRMLDRQKIPYELMNYECLLTEWMSLTNLGRITK